MDFFQAVETRRSVREFSSQPVKDSDITRIIEAGHFAPTARNIQPWEFVVIKNKETIRKISEFAPNGKFMVGAPACIAVFCQDTKYYLEDGSAATTNILNAANALGLGSCWIAGDKKDYCQQVSRMLDAPESYKLVSLIALGYPQGKICEPDKKPTESLIHSEKF